MPLEFGALVPCRMCRGTGKSRNPEWGDEQAVKERARRRRRGEDVDKATAITTCVECSGAGYLPPPGSGLATRRPRPAQDGTVMA